MKFTFTGVSAIIPTTPISCAVGAAGDSSVFSGISCTANPTATNPYVIVKGLVSNKNTYMVEITSIVNAPSTALIYDVKCDFCTDDACNSIVGSESANVLPPINFVSDVFRAADVSVRSTNHLNGETGSTLEFGILLGNKLVKDGTVIIDMPK